MFSLKIGEHKFPTGGGLFSGIMADRNWLNSIEYGGKFAVTAHQNRGHKVFYRLWEKKLGWFGRKKWVSVAHGDFDPIMAKAAQLNDFDMGFPSNVE